MADILDQIIQIPFGEDHYYKATYNKEQIVLHHSTTNGTAQALADYWETLENRIGTPLIIDKDGVIHQLFSSRYYAGHIGDVSNEMKKFNLPFRSCSKTSIGIEVINMGGLVRKGDVLYNSFGTEYSGEIVELANEYRGFTIFAKYTDKQIDSMRRVLIYLCNRYEIPKTYHDDIWSVNVRALSGEKGVFVHGSFREDKSNLYPDERVIQMLKSL